MELTLFQEKFNKLENHSYLFEEEAVLTDGVYEKELAHDNIVESSLAVHTGPKLTGDRILAYTLSTPSLAPWKRIIRVYADVPKVYISYETPGDTVEAEDINRLQAAVNTTQEELNREQERSLTAEKDLQAATDAEQSRAKQAERELAEQTGQETARALEKEEQLTGLIREETSRAETEERALREAAAAETVRAQTAEKTNAEGLAAETARAETAEKKHAAALTAETARAQTAETTLRSMIEEGKPLWEDKYTRNEVDNKFSALETGMDWKESVATFADLTATYPAPEDGWTVNVKDTDYTYRWNGTAWVAISANAIPKATTSLDGLLSKEDKALYDDANTKKHTHVNRTVLDKLTQALLDAWNNAAEHLSRKDNPHVVTKAQIGLGNVENKTGAAIRAGMTKAEVVSALGYTPAEVVKEYVHPDSGAKAGTYTKVTVNAQGHVTGGSNPDTLAGYGITDALEKGCTWNDLKGV